MMRIENLHGLRTICRQRLHRAQKSARLHLVRMPLLDRCAALLCGESEGSALVEIALVMGPMLAVLTAICAFAVGFNNQLTLTSAVGSGAQYLQLIRTTTTDPCKDTLTAIEGAAPSLTPSSIGLSFSLNGTTVTSTSCPGDQSDLAQGAPVTVTATYPCALPIYGTTFSQKCQLTAKVTEYEY
jgi:Flp pilus assembly protein TadG